MARRSSGKAKKPQAPAISIKRLQEKTKRELQQFSEKTIRSTYASLRKAIAARVKTFEKAGLGDVLPEKIRAGMAPMGNRSVDELLNDITSATAWTRGRGSTVKGYREARESFREKMQDAMPDLDLSDDDKMDEFGRYMGEMQERYGEMWHAISEAARDVFRDQTKLNEDPKQFMENYVYWYENVESVNAAKKAARAGGRRRSTKLSTYMNQLKRGKIR